MRRSKKKQRYDQSRNDSAAVTTFVALPPLLIGR